MIHDMIAVTGKLNMNMKQSPVGGWLSGLMRVAASVAPPAAPDRYIQWVLSSDPAPGHWRGRCVDIVDNVDIVDM